MGLCEVDSFACGQFTLWWEFREGNKKSFQSKAAQGQVTQRGTKMQILKGFQDSSRQSHWYKILNYELELI